MKIHLISTLLAGAFLFSSGGFLASSKLAQGRNSTSQLTRLEIEQKREQWFYSQRAYPHKQIPAGARLKALKQLDRMLAEDKALPSPGRLRGTWTQIGPEPAEFWSLGGSSGRATAVVVDPRNSNVVYLGTAGGGVWKTTDGGQNWSPLTDAQPSLAIGSLALDPSNPDIVYAGTGEENFSVDSYYGAGILKSTDGGTTWQLLPGPNPSDRGEIGSIAVHPAMASRGHIEE